MAASVTSLPPGRHIELPHRGTTFVRELAGPPGAPTLLLLHGWVATGGLNWYQVFEPLSEHFHVVAPDLRGHGRGVRGARVFRLADAADDCAQTLVELDSGPVIVAGYSMGGPIAQLMWRRHRDLVDGLVMCATTAGFFPDWYRRISSQAAMLAWVAAVRAGAHTGALRGVPPRVYLPGSKNLPLWFADEMSHHDWRMIVEAGHSICTYHARWINEVDVPTAIVRTTEDRGVAPDLQLALAHAIRGATVFDVADGHLACAGSRFEQPFLRACFDVADRAAHRVA